MQFEPMINARIRSFSNLHAFQGMQKDKLFELFVNDTILRNHQPDFSDCDTSLLDVCSVGGGDDMGIDGLAIKINGIFVSTRHDVDELIELNKQLSIEFIFIQSKNKDKLDSGEYGKFTDGIYDFLSDEHTEPHNEKIDALLQVKEYLFSDDVILRWKGNPSIRIYYVLFGTWRDSKHIEAKESRLESEINKLQCYNEVFFKNIDSNALKKLCEENENSFSSVINVIDDFGLNEVDGVENSLVVLCSASELIKVITTDDKLIRQSLFTDNVRDYQGDTDINADILNTIETAPSNFALLNNGITIVCTSVLKSNRKVTLTNPQIVNGCQTCNVLFEAFSQGIDITKVTLLAKIIATEKDELTTSVIRGTNSQNVVYNEAFETTRDFHKNLEDFFNVIQETDELHRIYYERRSRQYARNTSIQPSQIAGLKTLTQSFISVFLQAPHFGTSHEAILLKKFKNIIFVDGQSLLPYYTATLMCLNFERAKREGKIDRTIDNYKHHIMFIASEYIAGICPQINNSSKIDEYCNKLIDVVKDIDAYATVLNKCMDVFQETSLKWVKIQGKKYRHGIKDNPNFTTFLITHIRGGDVNKIDYGTTPDLIFRGRVVKSRRDRNGFYYGFIKRTPEDVFFHEQDNGDLDFNELYGKTVLYRVFPDDYNGDDRAVIMEVLSEEAYSVV